MRGVHRGGLGGRIVQDAYVKVLGRWGRLREVTKGAACLSQSVVNLSRSRLRLAARRARRARLLAVASAIAVAGAAALTVSFTGGGGLTTARPSHEASPSPDPTGPASRWARRVTTDGGRPAPVTWSPASRRDRTSATRAPTRATASPWRNGSSTGSCWRRDRTSTMS